MSKISIDAFPIKNVLHDRWDGEGSFKRYLRSEVVEDYIKSTLDNKMDYEGVYEYHLEMSENLIEVEFKEGTALSEIRKIANKLIDDHGIMCDYS